MYKNKKVLFVGGGGAAGFFSFGALTKLSPESAHQDIDAMYGVSCGIISIAFFISNTLDKAHTASDEIQRYLHVERLPRLIIQRLLGGKRKGKKPIEMYELDTFMNVVDEHKLIDYELLKNYPIPLYASLLNIDTSETEFHDIRTNPREIIRAGIALIPFCEEPVIFNDVEYVDGGISDPLPLKKIHEQNIFKKIILLINSPIPEPLAHRLAYKILAFIEGILSWASINKRAFIAFAERSFVLKESLKYISTNKHDIVYFMPKKQNRANVFTREKKILTEIYELGKSQSEELLGLIKSA